jgi:uncharacterized surface protein with fasciclin (FAS1) repeats/sporulation protein YlmC with PRC-barrel domain
MRLAATLVTAGMAVVAAGTVAAQSLGQTLAQESGYQHLRDAFERAELSEPVRPVTVFAPTDAAFEALPLAVRERLSAPVNRDILNRILRMHIVAGAAHPADKLPVRLSTMGQTALRVGFTSGELRLAPASVPDARVKVIDPDIVFDAGLVHGVNALLAPESLLSELEPPATAVIEKMPKTEVEAVLPESDTIRIDETDQASAIDDSAVSARDGADAANGQPPRDVPGAAERIARSADFAEVDAPDADEPGPNEPHAPDETARVDQIAPTTANAHEAAAAGDQNDSDAIVYTAPEDEDPGADARRQAGTETSGPTDDDAKAPGDRAISLTQSRISVSDLLGRNVRRASGAEDAGTIVDLLMALDTGRVETVVIETGDSFLGFGETETRRIALDAISIDPLDNAVIVPASALGGQN